MAKSGDDVAMAGGRYTSQRFESPVSTPALGPSDPGAGPPPLLTGWPGRRISDDSGAPFSSLPSMRSDDGAPIPSLRGRKRSVVPRDDEDMEPQGDPAMRGMEVLAESARRVQEAETKESEVPEQASGAGEQGANGVVAIGTGPKYVCSHCAKTFSRPSSLRIHTYSREYPLLPL